MTKPGAIDTSIRTLGTPKLTSRLPYRTWVDDVRLPIQVDRELCDEFTEPVCLDFEAAGPRKKLYFDPSRAKCAIVTCGGLCPGLNDVIRAIVMEAHHAYHVPSIMGIRYGLEGFIPACGHQPMELTPERVADIHRFGGTILGSSRGPQSAEEIVDSLERSNVSILFVIGGDGSMKAALSISREVQARNLKIAVIGIPKTIDNDINFIPQSFGFETAVYKATEAIECAHAEAMGCHNTIGLVKLMGRESGFIAAQATLSMRDVNFVLVPELPFEIDGPQGLLEAVFKRIRARGHAVIVAAEGAGQHLMQGTGKYDPSGNIVLSDIGTFLKERLKKFFAERNQDLTIKYIDPSYIIRSVHANTSDAAYCGQLGQHAVHAAMAGRTGIVVSRIMDEFVHVPLELVTAKRRKMDPKSELWRTVLESTGQWTVKGMRVEE